MPTVMVWARNNSIHVSLSADRKQAFLESARASFGDFLDAIFFGFTTNEIPLRTSACTIIWPLAFAWHKVDALMALKVEGDEFAVAGNLEVAMTKYRYAEFCASQWFERDFSKWEDEDSLDFMDDVIYDAMHALRFDIEFTIVLINFRSGKLPDPIKLGALSSSQEPRLRHLLLLCTLLLCRKGPPGSKLLLHSIRRLQSLPVTAEVLHDIHHLQNFLHSTIPEDFVEAFRGVFSFEISPFKVVDTVPDQDRRFHGRPEGLVRWQDTMCLAQFTEEEKDAIVSFQKWHGLRITDFEVDEGLDGGGRIAARARMG